MTVYLFRHFIGNWRQIRFIFPLIAGTLPIILSYPTLTQAQTLPPPPPLPVPSAPPSTAYGETSLPPQPPQSADSVREFTFQAPQPHPVNDSATNPSSAPATVQFYRVEVANADGRMLAQVRQIEPFAFFETHAGVIYAGQFLQSGEAQQRVQVLEQQGFTANVVPVQKDVEATNNVPRQLMIRQQ